MGLKCGGSLSGDAVSVNCSLSSVSGPDGDQILQVYHRASSGVIGAIGGAHPVPQSALVGYSRVFLPAGTVLGVDFGLSMVKALALVDGTGASVLYPGVHYLDVWDGGANNVTVSVEVTGPQRVVKRPPVPQ